MYIPDEIIEEIRRRCDIVDIISSNLGGLKRTGANFKALCPFHQEKTPSFIVNPRTQTFHCFGCGKGGDVFRFIMEREGVDFIYAVRYLADKCGVVIPENRRYAVNTKDVKKRHSLKERLLLMHEELCTWYEDILWNRKNPLVFDYFLSRHIPEKEAKKFRLGASLDSWTACIEYLSSKGYNEHELKQAGVVKYKEESPNNLYDAFRNRLMFPICDEFGKVIGFSARTVEKDFEGGKYINSPETPIFYKSRTLFGMHLARKAVKEKDFLILCEGQLDTIAMHCAGFSNTVAPQGTAFTPEQARAIKRYTDRVFIAFDADAAGIKAILRAVEIALSVGLEVKVILFPEGKDPDEIYHTNGEEAIVEIVNNALDFFDFMVDYYFKGVNRDSAWETERAIDPILEAIAAIDNSITRASYVTKAANYIGLPDEALFEIVQQKRSKKGSRRRDNVKTETNAFASDIRIKKASSDMSPCDPKLLQVLNAEKTLLELILTHGVIGKKLFNELPFEFITKTGIGKALEKAIHLTQEGEWDRIPEKLQNMMNQDEDSDYSEVTKILACPAEYEKNISDKVLHECIITINSFYIEKEIFKLKQALKECVNDEERKKQILEKFHRKCAELNELKKLRSTLFISTLE